MGWSGLGFAFQSRVAQIAQLSSTMKLRVLCPHDRPKPTKKTTCANCATFLYNELLRVFRPHNRLKPTKKTTCAVCATALIVLIRWFRSKSCRIHNCYSQHETCQVISCYCQDKSWRLIVELLEQTPDSPCRQRWWHIVTDFSQWDVSFLWSARPDRSMDNVALWPSSSGLPQPFLQRSGHTFWPK